MPGPRPHLVALNEAKRVPFHDLYTAEPTSGCWLWLGSVRPDGYGQVQRHAKYLYAHRLAWTIFHGMIPAGMAVLHRCDVRCCVNPNHLFLGTLADNNADMKKKGRSKGTRGELSGMSKLTADQVRAIRADPRPQVAIARDYGVTNTAVWKIKHRTRWRHIP